MVGVGVLEVSEGCIGVGARVGLANTVGDQFHMMTGIALGCGLVSTGDRVITDMGVPTVGLTEG
jgi:hypothetical protein